MLDGAAVNNDAYTANYYGDYNYEAPLGEFQPDICLLRQNTHMIICIS